MQEPHTRRSRWIWVVLALVPVLYVLSIGPVVYFVQTLKLTGGNPIVTCLEYFYFPLEYIHESEIQPCQYFLESYLSIWERLARVP